MEPNIEYSPRTSLVQVRIGNHIYDAQYVASCHTCTHPARMEIEQKVLQNFSYLAIERMYSEVEVAGRDGSVQVLPRVGWTSIRGHFKKGHMPVAAAALRELAERRALEIGSSYEEMASRFVDHVTVAQAVIQRGHDRLIAGEIEPDVKDTLAAAKFLKEVEDSTLGSVDTEAWGQAMMIYFETAQRLMPAPMWDEFTRALSADPILRALAQKMAGETPAIESSTKE